jgi:hypothetical protein
MEFKHDRQQQSMVFQKKEIELKRKEIDAKYQALQFQLTQHQDDMRLRFIKFEQRI